ncbi:MAG: hypothetical protein ACFFEF_19370 [Candidatus Thorarchaeota archaeon]
MRTRSVSVILLITIIFTFLLPALVQAPPLWTYFKIGSPIDVDDNMTMNMANVTVDITPTTDETESYLTSAKVNVPVMPRTHVV